MATQPIANDAATDIFTDLDPKSIALLLDVDGTIIDIGLHAARGACFRGALRFT